MTNGSNRESELEIIRQLLIATASRTESNSASVGRHQERMDQLTGGIDQLAIAQQNTQANFDQLAIAQQNTQANFDQLAIAQQNTQANFDQLAVAQQNTQANFDQLAIAQQNTQANFDQLAVAQQNTQANFDQLAALTVRFIENAEVDRAVIREIQSEVRGLQTENRHIWEYLMLQDGNGNGDQPQP